MVVSRFWQLVTDALAPQEAAALKDELGIEWDSGEHTALERSALCERKVTGILKRKRGDM
jgi:26S proteasome regulatory subunit (ATPase 3-interacting protein)